ncbi:hypothetical protein [Tunturiibacter gelidoferens]|uniref:Uncharacterized protein n=1 Tax=Tunturiibacter gelidiferens TaxID=3069689 RepID=A0A9X0U6S7_9BACT|nr:hypothetical protein [Edaphobacter lichenicola]MBB5331793.1 hypothetical protein [Edaphobacter lichenicola]
MARPRKTLEELKLSGTFQQNKARYSHMLPSAEPTAAHPATEGLGEPPSHLKAADKKAWHEVVAMTFPGTLEQKDRLLVEIASQLLVKQRAGTIKVAELKQLTTILTGFQSRSRATTSVAPTPNESIDPSDEFFAQCDKEDAEEKRVRVEMERRRNLGPQEGQTHAEFDRWCRWATVRDEFAQSSKSSL